MWQFIAGGNFEFLSNLKLYQIYVCKGSSIDWITLNETDVTNSNFLFLCCTNIAKKNIYIYIYQFFF